MSDKKVLIRSMDLKQYFPVGKKRFSKANDGITLDIYQGETLGLVGESGCGKSTFGRTLLQLNKQTSGKSLYYGRELDEVAPKYVGKMLTAYEKNLNAYHAMQAEVKKQEAECEANGAGAEKLEELCLKRTEAESRYYDIVSVVGGFVTVENNAEALKLLKEEHEICREIRDTLESVKIAQVKYEDSAYEVECAEKEGAASGMKIRKAEAAKTRVEQLAHKHDQLKLRLEKKRREIEALKKPYMQDEAFCQAEAMKDNSIDLARLEYDEMRLLRSDLQMIFQDPYSSLNPRMTVGNIIGQGMKTHHMFCQENMRMQRAILDVMQRCGLQSYFLHRFPHQFSGGQRQRIGIARSLAVNPKFVVCDEAVSALDVSIQSQIINLLQDLKEQQNLTYLFITHDLSVVKYISDRIGVMYLGNIVELASAEEIFADPAHPYTQALIDAIPTVDKRGGELKTIEGDIPSPVNPPKGCKFHTRCTRCSEVCKRQKPVWEEIKPGHFAACFRAHEVIR